MRKIKITFVVLFLILISFPAFATPKFRDAINFEDNEFVEMGSLEILHRYQKYSGADSDDLDMAVLDYQFTYGVMTNFEVGVKIPIVFQENNGQDEIGDMSVSQRFKFTEESQSGVDFSGGLELILPTGDEKETIMGSDDLDARFHLSLGQSIDQDLRWLAHLAYRFYGEADNDDLFEYNTAFSYKMSPNFKSILELNGSSGGYPDYSELYISPGFVFQPRGGFTTTVSVPVGVTNDSYDHKANLQLAIEF